MRMIRFYCALLLVPLVIACTQQSDEQLMKNATQALQKEQYHRASIALKNIIQRTPDYPMARETLGVVYLNQGMYLAAEKEFNRVAAPSHNKTLGLAEIYLWQEKVQEVLDLVSADSTSDKNAANKLSVLRAIAFYRAGQRLKALHILNELEEADTQNSATYLAAAYNAIIDGRNNEAKSLIQASIESDPSFFLSYELKSIIASIEENYETESDALKAYLDLRKKDYKVKVRLADSLIKMQDYVAAAPLVDQLLKISENQPYFNQLKAVLEFEKGNFDSALSFAEKSLQNGGNSQIIKLVAALSHYQLGNSEQSHQFLKSIISSLPKGHFAHKLFALLQLQLGYTSDAEKSLNALNSLSEKDAPFFLEATRDLLLQDKKSIANDLLGKVVLTNNTDETLLRQIGALKMIANDDSGVIELEKHFNRAQTPEALIALGAAYIDLGEQKKALELTKDWLKDHPNDVAVINFQARSYIYLGRLSEAEEAYNRTLSLQPSNLGANVYFIDKLVEQGDLEAANNIYSELMSAHPTDLALLLRYFQFSVLLDKPEQALVFMRNALQKSDDVEYHLIYAGALSLLDRPAKVISHLTPLQNVANDNAKYWMLLGGALDNLGQLEKAYEAYNKWLNIEKSINAYVKTAYTAEKLGMFNQALQLIDSAIEEFPKMVQLDLIKAHLLLESGEVYNAKSLLGTLPKDITTTPTGLVLLGRVKLIEGKFDTSTKLFKQAYEKNPTNKAINFYFLSLVKMGQDSKAIELADKHLSIFPEDTSTRLMLANLLFTYDQNRALEQYQLLAENAATPNIVVLNNLAWLLNEQGDSQEALVHIKSALNVLPDHPFLLATLGSIKVSLGSFDEAVTALERAFVSEPNSTDIGIEYVTALYKSGEKEKASEVLETLSPKSQAEIAAVNRLAKEIGV